MCLRMDQAPQREKTPLRSAHASSPSARSPWHPRHPRSSKRTHRLSRRSRQQRVSRKSPRPSRHPGRRRTRHPKPSRRQRRLGHKPPRCQRAQSPLGRKPAQHPRRPPRPSNPRHPSNGRAIGIRGRPTSRSIRPSPTPIIRPTRLTQASAQRLDIRNRPRTRPQASARPWREVRTLLADRFSRAPGGRSAQMQTPPGGRRLRHDRRSRPQI